MTILLLITALICSFIFATVSHSQINRKVFDFYAIVIDTGSTGSRSFIFNIKEEFSEFGELLERSIQTLKGRKFTPGLSDFANKIHDSESIVNYLLPMFKDAAQRIPINKHNTTQVYVKGTAGMRLLLQSDQNAIWRILYEGLNKHPDNPFYIPMKNFGTITGHMEAYYAVLSSNFIVGAIDEKLRVTGREPLVGAMDMGGSSTQLIFYTGSEDEYVIKPENFWSHSWINFGLDKIKERLNKYIVQNKNLEELNFSLNSSNTLRTFYNPCFFHGYQEIFDGNIIAGTGERIACQDILREILWPGKICNASSTISSSYEISVAGDAVDRTPCYLDGIEHPPIRGRFYGMSAYFFAIDCIRHLSNSTFNAWPSPSIDELEDMIHQFCNLPWTEVEKMYYEGEQRHRWTKSSHLPNRCLEALYMAMLLEDGFGFHGAGRNITLVHEVNGQVVEWTLGLALSEIHALGNYEPEPIFVLEPPKMTDINQIKTSITRMLQKISQNIYEFISSIRNFLRFK